MIVRKVPSQGRFQKTGRLEVNGETIYKHIIVKLREKIYQ